ncbi:FxLYD domain-containing protein [uncultured Brachyspira sp.]|uniref:FxLYD domain-containing protein n=1 Tax=uncultured Brachyspira sp. TaxID=221953 RepID=UPI002613D4A2|nr:FxLYD domain-containing protein [uncultured Brachyspira sp.]
MSQKKTRICPHCKKEVNAMATRCPYCTSKITPPIVKKYTILFIIFIVAVSLIFNFFSNIFSSKKEKAAEKRLQEMRQEIKEEGYPLRVSFSSDDYEVDNLRLIEEEYKSYITGEVYNKTSKAYSNVVIEFDLYDYKENHIGVSLAIEDYIGANDKIKFKSIASTYNPVDIKRIDTVYLKRVLFNKPQ